jgi:hypothetical protein
MHGSWELAAYSAVEKRKKGEVLRKASAEGRAARARAPTRVLTMMMSGDGGWMGLGCLSAMFTGAQTRCGSRLIGTSHSTSHGWRKRGQTPTMTRCL